MTSYLSSAGKGVTDLGTGVGKGVGEVGKGVGKGVGEIGKGVGIGGKDESSNPANTTNQPQQSTNDQSAPEKKDNEAGQPQSAPENTSSGGGIGGALSGIGGSATKGLGVVGNAGADIAGSLSKASVDLNRSVVKGVGTIGGTAVDGVINVATTTTDGVLSPIANNLKAIEGLEALGEGVDSINGISTDALQSLSKAAKGAIEAAGKTPTFFNPTGDGIVKMTDTQKGFVALGLEDRYAKIAAWALHSTFSYPTSESWNPTSLLSPSSGYEFPIKVENMDKTKWGKNWGNFERVEWVKDADVERFFGMRERTTWAHYWADIQSYFGTALLIFEWGTTWPYMSVPGSDLVAGQIGTVLRTVILPTIAKTHEKEKAQNGEQDKPNEKPPTPPPFQEREGEKA
ncbi:hypothetical protein V5O48_000244 [Marasmius crinis-equi]|uniref:Uncharacterized protein n=1 Tax=Marasmius crinis-equi TaxID=585013 RepID=A0ABR3G1P3_9AGAR